MLNEVVSFLTSEAKHRNLTVYEAMFGQIDLNEKKPIKQSSGAVYGILVESETPLNCEIKTIKGYPNLYPIYWGKDIAPVSRLKAHVQNHENTGNANLKEIEEIQDKKLIFGAILVSDYQGFEKYLHDTYPPLKGSNKIGKQSEIVEILN